MSIERSIGPDLLPTAGAAVGGLGPGATDALFARIVATTPHILHIIDLQEKRTVYLNAHVTRVLGYSPHELQAFDSIALLAVLHPDDAERALLFGRAYDALPDGEVAELAYRMRHKAGHYLWLLTRSVIFSRTPEGKAHLVLATTQDVTAQEQARRDLAAREAHLRALADAMPHLVWTAAADGTVDYYNSRAREYDGLRQRADGSWNWQPIVHPDDLAATVLAWETAVREGGVYQCEQRIRMADGSVRWHLSRAFPMRDETGAVVRWFGTATDVQDLRQAEGELLENDRRKDEFLAMLAHELRNPLAPIRNAVRVLHHLGPLESRVEQMRDMIERQTEHLTRLVDDLLDVSRITRGKIILRYERNDLLTIVSRAVETSRPAVDAARHRLTVSLPREPVRVDGDPTRLAQVISNLLNNAAKYTLEGGRIDLSAERTDDIVAIRVRDTGIGIPPADLPYVFDLFAQADRSLDRAQGGLGIGLTLVRRLVEMHGGRVEAHSAGPGRGSEFVVCLPASSDPPSDKPSPSTTRPPARARRPGSCRVLVVDDHADSADSLACLLEMAGHEVRTARDGRSTMEIARTFAPHVVLLDIGLPGMNGYEVARQLRADPKHARILLVAITGYGQADDRGRAREAGFDHHLTKPVDHDVLSAILAAVDHECGS